MAKYHKLTPEALSALETYIMTLVTSSEGSVTRFHVSGLIPGSDFGKFPDFTPTNPALIYDKRSGWFTYTGE